MKAIQIVNGDAEIKAIPGPVEPRNSLSISSNPRRCRKGVDEPAQFDFGQVGSGRKLEGVKEGSLGERSNCSPARL